MTRRVRLGARSRARVKAGGKLAQGRPSVSLARWREIVAEVKRRADGRCEVVFEPSHPMHHRWGSENQWACLRRGRHPHHLLKRSAGGADEADNIIWICVVCHRMTDASYLTGRLLFRREGRRLLGRVVFAPDKFSARGQG